MADVVFLCPGGMGDLAPTTTLAERLWREQGREFYYRISVRNPGIWDFWTRDNPYCRGFSSNQVTHNAEFGPIHDELLQRYGNNVAAHEAMVGLPPPYNTLPKIYWQPYYDPKWKGKVVLSTASVTVPFSADTIEQYVEWLIRRKAFTRDQLVFVQPPAIDTTSTYPAVALSDVPRWQPTDVFEKATAIHSCDIFVCTESGDAAMGSAIRARTGFPLVLAVSSTGTFNREEFRWGNVRYYNASNVREDWI